MSSDEKVGGFFSTLGAVDIWTNIIITPILILTIIYAIFAVQKYDKGYKTATAVVTNAPKCTRHEGLKGEGTGWYGLHLTWDDDKDDGVRWYCDDVDVSLSSGKLKAHFATIHARENVHQNDKHSVCYDPAHVSKDTAKVIEWRKCFDQRTNATILLCVILALAIAGWIMNFALRNNETYRKLEGVSQAASWVGGAFGRN